MSRPYAIAYVPGAAQGSVRPARKLYDPETEFAVRRFFQIRWPGGFRCPHCGHGEYTEITTRSLPLYQCRKCRKQTSLTAGTIMHKSRTPLSKWLDAVDFLAASPGMSAAALAEAVGITTKAAWLMLKKFRQAISRFESERKLEGDVKVGLRVVAPAWIWMFWELAIYKSERVVAVSASVDEEGNPREMKLTVLDPKRDLEPDSKIATPEARGRLMERTVSQGAKAEWLRERRRFPEKIDKAFKRARTWLVEVFNGVGTKYLQSYLDEYCFRWNVSVRGESLREAWLRLCC